MEHLLVVSYTKSSAEEASLSNELIQLTNGDIIADIHIRQSDGFCSWNISDSVCPQKRTSINDTHLKMVSRTTILVNILYLARLPSPQAKNYIFNQLKRKYRAIQ